MISAGMLATMVYQLGGGRNGWSLAELIHRVQNMDFWYATVEPRQRRCSVVLRMPMTCVVMA